MVSTAKRWAMGFSLVALLHGYCLSFPCPQRVPPFFTLQNSLISTAPQQTN